MDIKQTFKQHPIKIIVLAFLLVVFAQPISTFAEESLPSWFELIKKSDQQRDQGNLQQSVELDEEALLLLRKDTTNSFARKFLLLKLQSSSSTYIELKQLNNALKNIEEYYALSSEDPKVLKNYVLQLHNIASNYGSQNDYKNAIYYFKKALTVNNKKNNKLTIKISASLSAIYLLKKDYPNAEKYKKKQIKYQEKDGSKNVFELLASKKQLATIYVSAGDYRQANTLLLSILEVAGKNKKINDKFIAHLQESIGHSFYKMDDYQQAEKFFKQSLHIMQDKFDNDIPAITTIKSHLASLYSDKNQLDKVTTILLDNISMLTLEIKKMSEKHDAINVDDHKGSTGFIKAKYEKKELAMFIKLLEKKLSNNMNELGIHYFKMNQLDKAEKIFNKTLKINNKNTAVKSNLYLIYMKKLEFKRAEKQLKDVERENEANYPPYHIKLAGLYHNLFAFYFEIESYKKAQHYLDKYKQVIDHSGNKESLYYSTYYEDLNEFYKKTGRYKEAEQYAYKSLVLNKKLLPAKHPRIARSYMSLAFSAKDRAKYQQAEVYYKKSIAVYKDARGNEHADTLLAKNNLAVFYSSMGKNKKAKKIAQDVVSILRKKKNKKVANSALLSRVLDTLGVIQKNIGEYQQAGKVISESLQLHEKYFSSNHRYVLQGKGSLAALHYAKGEYKEAINIYHRLIEKVKKNMPANHLLLMGFLNNLAIVYEDVGQYEKAKSMHQENISVIKKWFSAMHPKMITPLNNLGSFYIEQRNFTEAEKKFRQALTLAQQKYSASHPIFPTIFLNLSTLYRQQGNYTGAKEYLQRALNKAKEIHSEKHPVIADILNNFSAFYIDTGDYNNAEKLAIQSLHIYKQLYHSIHPNIALGLENLGSVYTSIGDYTKAASLYNASLTMRKAIYNKHHPKIIDTYNRLSNLYHLQNDFQQAKHYAEISQQCSQHSLLPKNHTSIVTGKNALALALVGQKDFTTAKKLLTDNLNYTQGKASLDYAATLNNLGTIAYEQGEMEQAIKHFEKAYKINRHHYLDAHPDFARNQYKLAQAYHQLAHPDKALEFAQQAVQTLKKYQQRQTEAVRKKNYAQSQQLPAFLTLLDLSEQQVNKTPQHLSAAFEALQLAHGSQRNNVLTQAVLRLAADKPVFQQQLKHLYDKKQHWKSLNNTLMNSVAENDSDQKAGDYMKRLYHEMTVTEKDIIELDTSLSNSFPLYKQLINPQPVTLTQVQQLLQNDEALLAFVSGEKESYLFVVKHNKSKLIRLAIDQKDLQKQIKQLREPLGSMVAKQLKSFDLDLSYKLYSKLLAPASTELQGIKHLITITDNVMKDLPFSVLVSKKPLNPQYNKAAWLIQHFSLAQLPAVNALPLLRNTLRSTSSASRPFIGFGDAVLSDKKSSNRSPIRYTHGVIANIDALKKLPNLPDTAVELKTIAQLMKVSERETVYLKKRASEGKVKQFSDAGRLANYRYVAFASHALLATEANAFNVPEEAGIVLTPPTKATLENDGYLSSSEILQLKLNANMVLLSACNTAKLSEKNASGLSSLAKSFFFAGSRSILASQWEADSQSATALITHLLKKTTQNKALKHAEALRQSMLEHMQYIPSCNWLCQIRDTLGIQEAPTHMPFAHPAYWATFVVIGDGR